MPIIMAIRIAEMGDEPTTIHGQLLLSHLVKFFILLQILLGISAHLQAKMSLYPSLEDMKVDQMAQVSCQLATQNPPDG